MRVLKISIYILAALVTGELSREANALGTIAEECTGVEGQTGEGEFNTLSLGSLSCALASEAPPRFTRPVSVALSTQGSDLAQATSFSDLQGNWAESFIQALTARNIIQGFPDGSFRPNQPVTRAQFAAMIRKAFQKNLTQEVIEFVDVPAYYWAREAIQSAYQMGFLAGYPNRVFKPNQNIPRAQVLVALANGLDLSAKPETTAALNTYFQDAAQIPDYARNSVAAAAEKSIIVNYPSVKLLNPNQIATRADVAAFIYQALASSGAVPQLTASNSVTQYIVSSHHASTPSSTSTVTAPPAAEVEDLQSRLLVQGTRTSEFGKVHRQLPRDFAVAVSYNGFLNNSDFDDVLVPIGDHLACSYNNVGGNQQANERTKQLGNSPSKSLLCKSTVLVK